MNIKVETKNLEELCEVLGLPMSEIPKLKIRLEIVHGIRNTIFKSNLTHLEASKKCNVGRTVITAIVNGNLNKISTDRLIDIAQALGLSLKIKVA